MSEPVKSLTDAELAEIRAREQAARPGSWEWDRERGRLVEKQGRSTVLFPVNFGVGVPQIEGSYGNFEFIACARTDIPRLLATIDELKAILADCTQDSLAYLAGVREGRRQAEGLPQNHYRYDWFCETCGRETFHDCKDSGHERDSSQDYRKCLVCGAERWGWQVSFK